MIHDFSRIINGGFQSSYTILRRPQNFADFCLQHIHTKVRWRFRKNLRPSQNIYLDDGIRRK